MNGRRTIGLAILLTGLATTSIATAQTDLVESARHAVQEGDAEAAIETLEQLHRVADPSAESLYVLALAYQIRLDEVGFFSKRGVASRLKKALEQALELEPEHLRAREELADFYFFAPRIVGGSKRKAQEQIARLERISEVDGHRVRGRHAYNDEEFRDAIQHFSRAIEVDSSLGMLWYYRGSARAQLLEQDVAALADLEVALELGVEQPQAFYHVGRLCVRLGSCPDRGEAVLLRYVDMSSGRDRAWGYYRLAQLHEQSGRLQDSLGEADCALELLPDHDQARALRARVAEKLKSQTNGSK